MALFFAALLPPVAIPLGVLAILLGASAHAELRGTAPAGGRVAYAGLLLGALAVAASLGIAILGLSS